MVRLENNNSNFIQQFVAELYINNREFKGNVYIYDVADFNTLLKYHKESFFHGITYDNEIVELISPTNDELYLWYNLSNPSLKSNARAQDIKACKYVMYIDLMIPLRNAFIRLLLRRSHEKTLISTIDSDFEEVRLCSNN